MPTDEAKQAQQLDSVTDVVQEQEVDIAKAQQALTEFSPQTISDDPAEQEVAQEDIDWIVAELEVTEAMARTTLRQVANDLPEGETLVVAALRKLVTM